MEHWNFFLIIGNLTDVLAVKDLWSIHFNDPLLEGVELLCNKCTVSYSLCMSMCLVTESHCFIS